MPVNQVLLSLVACTLCPPAARFQQTLRKERSQYIATQRHKPSERPINFSEFHSRLFKSADADFRRTDVVPRNDPPVRTISGRSKRVTDSVFELPVGLKSLSVGKGEDLHHDYAGEPHRRVDPIIRI